MKQGNNNNSCSTCSCDYLQLHLLPAPKSLFSERFNVRVMSIIWFIALVASFSLKYLPISEIKILPMLMSTYFYGGSCVEDVTTHLMNHLSLHPTLRTCSSDTILRAIKELTQENISYTSDAGKNYDFKVLPSENAFPTFLPSWI